MRAESVTDGRLALMGASAAERVLPGGSGGDPKMTASLPGPLREHAPDPMVAEAVGRVSQSGIAHLRRIIANGQAARAGAIRGTGGDGTSGLDPEQLSAEVSALLLRGLLAR